MMKEKRRTRRAMGSLALVGSLTALSVALGAGDVAIPPMSKDQTVARMLEIGKEIANLRSGSQTRQVRNTLDRLMREYHSLSLTLGGDDPAHIDNADPSARAAGGDDGGIATAPAAPAGCTSSAATFTNATSTPIPNPPAQGTPVGSTITVSGVDSYLWDVNLTTFITHTSSGDLDITLTSPAGTIVTITTDNGAGNDNIFNGTVWDDSADALQGGQGLVTDHTYANLTLASPLTPEEPLGAFIGENPNGVWTLSISDDAGGDAGLLNSWSLGITTAPAAPTTTLTSGSNAVGAAIPSGPSTVPSSINIAGAQSVLTDVNVTATITHTNCADLDITLTSPQGKVVTLTTDNGGTNDNVYNGTTWDDDANPGGAVPYATNNGVTTDHAYVNLVIATPLTPEEPLAAFIGENPNGNWTLTINDDAAANGGTLASWSLNILSAASAPSTSTTSFSNSTPAFIDAIAPATSQIVVSGIGTFLWDVDVTTFIQHTSGTDLDVTVKSPAGTIVTLTTDNGGTLDNTFNGTTWDDDANMGGQVPYTSNSGLANDQTYVNLTTASPLVGEEALGAFIGEDPNGTWTITLSDDAAGADVGTLSSWSVNLTTLDATPTSASSVNYPSTAVPVTISSTGMPTVSSTLTVSGASSFLKDLNLNMNLTHSFDGDLDITLTSPIGTIVTITTDNGGPNDNVFAGTLFDDDANPGGQVPYGANNGLATDHAYADIVVATPLAPEEALAAFIGEDPNGTWTLTISDDTNGDGGSLNSWSIDIVTCDCSGGAPCPGDIDGSSSVDVNDLLAVITTWGPCPGCPPLTCPGDISPAGGDCNIDVNDLLQVITTWGPCP